MADQGTIYQHLQQKAVALSCSNLQRFLSLLHNCDQYVYSNMLRSWKTYHIMGDKWMVPVYVRYNSTHANSACAFYNSPIRSMCTNVKCIHDHCCVMCGSISHGVYNQIGERWACPEMDALCTQLIRCRYTFKDLKAPSILPAFQPNTQ